MAATVAAGVAIAAVGLIAFNVVRATRVDAEGFEGFLVLRRLNLPRVNVVPLAQAITDSVTPLAFIPIGLILVALAIERRRPLVVAALPVIIGGSVLSSAALKSAIGGQSAAIFHVPIIPGPSFPSGHATASMALVLCAVLASPPQWQGLVTGLGAIYAIAVGYALIVIAVHLPSDVVGGYLMAGLWALLAVMALGLIERRLGLASDANQAEGPRLKPLVALLSVFVLAVAAILVATAHGPHQPAPAAFVASAIGIALVAVLVIYVFARLGSDWGRAISIRQKATATQAQREC